MTRWIITFVFLIGLTVLMSKRLGFAQVPGAPAIHMPGSQDLRMSEVFQRTESPLNERLQMKYIRQTEMKKRLKDLVRISLRQSAEYDDNISRQSDAEKKADIIYTTEAEFHLNLLKIEPPDWLGFFKDGSFNLGLTYLFVYDSYRRNEDLNDKDDIFGFDIDVPTFQLPFFQRGIGRKIEITVSDNMHPEEFTNDLIEDRGKRQFRFTNDFNAVLSYPITRKALFSFPYLNRIIRYRDSELKSFSSMSHNFAPTFSYALTPKTSFFVGGRYGIFQFQDDTDNYNTFSLQGGIFKTLTAKVNVGFSAGYQVRTFNNRRVSLENTGNDSGSDRLGSAIFEFLYNHRISRKTNFRIEAGNGITDSLSTLGSLSGTRSVQEVINEGNPSVIRMTLSAQLDHSLTEKISVFTRGEVISERGGDQSRNDLLYSWETGFSYRLRHNLSLNLDYQYTLRNSDFSNDDFGNNLLTLSLDYDLGGGESLVNVRRGGKAFANA